MMEDHFGLERAPFRLGTDARFYYEAEAHRRAMAHLRYGLRQAEGFVVITGEPGVGKTMVVEQLLLAVQDSDVLAGMLSPAGLTPENLAERVLAAFDRRVVDGADPTDSLKDYLADERRRGAKASLIVDEAQHLSDAILEELRLLSDLTHDGDALLQVCLIGQTALRRVLFRDDMEQFRQRIVASYHLAPLSAEDTEAYVRHRLKAAGHRGPDIFTENALGTIHRLTGGVPRRINTLCARLLLQAAMDGRNEVDSSDAQGTAQELEVAGPDDEPAPAENMADPSAERQTVPDEEGTGEAATGEPPAEQPTPQRPNLTLVQNTGAVRQDQPQADDTAMTEREEEEEAERALALVTSKPPSPLEADEDVAMSGIGRDEEEEEERRLPGTTGSTAYSGRIESTGGHRGYPISVGEINAAILSLQTESAPKIDRPTFVKRARGASQRPMASPQELMMRPKKAQPTGATEAAAQPADPVAPPEPEPVSDPAPRTGEPEKAIADFLAETEAALADLRQSMTTLKQCVSALDERRRRRREHVGESVEAAKRKLDEAAREG